VSSAPNVIEFPRRSSALDLEAFGDLRKPTEERLQLARDLHDVVSYSFATISVQAGAALHRAQERPELAVEALEAIRSASKEALNEFRGLIARLRRIEEPEAASSPAGLGRLEALGATTTAAGVTTTVRVEGRPRPLPAAVDAAAYRIVQESLANVLRHARAASALVTIRYERDRLSLEVSDDGRSAVLADRDRSDGSGHGIAGMRERADALGGELEAGSRAEGGFCVRARLPILISL
jgi:signal transduction histidine kinase